MNMSLDEQLCDGIHNLVPREKMHPSARKLRDTYAITPGIPLYRKEFGYYCMERWKEQGLPEDVNMVEYFDYDPPGGIRIGGVGGCAASFYPAFEEIVIEDRGDTEVAQDSAGRHVLFFKGRRSGFMPEYIEHPVKDWKTWEENVKWRLDPSTPERYVELEKLVDSVKNEAGQGKMVTENIIGAYMYLRSLIGPEDLLYFFYDKPDLIHDCMKTWLDLSIGVVARHQESITLDEVLFGEDICYNNGSLISPDMIKEFLVPYYQQLLNTIKSNQIDKNRHLYINIDTDGYAVPVIPIYMKEIGMDVMEPFEVASYCDVVEIGKQFPDLVMSGGIDKRILAQSKENIDKHLEYIIPTMRERGGYIPTCDHGVPEEVTLENYLYYRKRCIELGG